MNKTTRILIAALALTTLSACADGSAPTGTAPARPAYNGGGFGMGGGNVVATDSTTETTNTSTTIAAPDSSDGRGGFGMGGGN